VLRASIIERTTDMPHKKDRLSMPSILGKPQRALAACIACAALQACSMQQMYATGQQWQRNQCQKIDDRAERARCEDGVARSFDDYQVQRHDAAKR
jgi:predicted amino acid dehydrogenase